MTGDGWATIPNWLVRDPEVSPQAKLLYVYLNSRVGRTGTCWPSLNLIVEETGMGSTSVKKALKDLRELGVLESETVTTKVGRHNLYRLHSTQGGSVGMRPTGQSPVTTEEEPVEEKNASTAVEAPRRRSTQALVARWVEGHVGAGRHRPPDAQVRKFGHHAAGLVKELTKRNGTLRDCLDSDWQRALDTAYYLGAKAVYPIVASYFGENGTPPDLPPDGRYVLYESGAVAVW